MAGWVGMLTLLTWLLPSHLNQAILLLWYAMVPFHYFVDGRIWRSPRRAPA
ncbi:hypothetical protein D3C83_187260 [compost metagenome]